jgi:Lar family restriction alleviation protein
MTDTHRELSPCPFCGEANALRNRKHLNVDLHGVTCDKCDAESGWWATPEDAAAAWNRRTQAEVDINKFLDTREHAFDEWSADDETFAKYGHNSRSCFYAGWKYRGRQLAGVQVMDARPSLMLLIGAVKAAHTDMFQQCCSNPIKNAWGKEVSVRKINDAFLLAERLQGVFRVPDGVLLEAIREEVGEELFDMQSPDTWLRVAGAVSTAGAGVIFEKENG